MFNAFIFNMRQYIQFEADNPHMEKLRGSFAPADTKNPS